MEKVKKMVGRAWCGTYKNGGQLGWVLPEFLDKATSLSSDQKAIISGENSNYYPADFYRVKITVVPVRDKRGKLIVKRNKRAAAAAL